MTTIKHPTIPNMVRDVPDSEADNWLAQGWELDDSEPQPIDLSAVNLGPGSESERLESNG